MDIVYDRDGELFHLQTAEDFGTNLFAGYLLCPPDAVLLQQTHRELS